MPFGLSSELLVVAAVIFVMGTMVCMRVVSLPTALVAAAIKTIIPLVYFAYLYEVPTTLDDVVYFNTGSIMLSKGYTLLSVFFDPDALTYLMMLAGGHHILYGWFNMLAQSIFGEFYFAPVFLNVALTFSAAYWLYRIAVLSDFSFNYSRGLFFFFLLHWEVVSWSSFVNLKDTLILSMTILFVYTVMRLVQTKRMRFVGILCCILFLFYFLRFYVPLLMLISVFIYILIQTKGLRFIQFLVYGGVVVVGYSAYMGFDQVIAGVMRLNIDFDSILLGLKMTLTPRPWGIDPEYQFLFIASFFHWLFYFPMLIGIVMMWRQYPQVRILLIYFTVVVLFYGSYTEGLGPRQRLQVSFIYAWAQFHFCRYYLLKYFRKKSISSTL
jgi:hypothetical protein